MKRKETLFFLRKGLYERLRLVSKDTGIEIPTLIKIAVENYFNKLEGKTEDNYDVRKIYDF